MKKELLKKNKYGDLESIETIYMGNGRITALCTISEGRGNFIVWDNKHSELFYTETLKQARILAKRIITARNYRKRIAV